MGNVHQIMMGCHIYLGQEKRWPEDLKTLVPKHLVEQVLRNPRQPGRVIGYVYVRPPVLLNMLAHAERTVVVYEAHEVWSEGGIAVGFADGHVQTVRSEEELKELLEFGAPVKEDAP